MINYIVNNTLHLKSIAQFNYTCTNVCTQKFVDT